MTLLNSASEGLPAELIVLARVAAEAGPLAREELVEICSIGGKARLGGAVSRWTYLGLLVETERGLVVSEAARPLPRESLNDWTDRLPAICRTLAFAESSWSPLFGETVGTSADLVKGLSWILAQDIFSMPRVWNDGVDVLESRQLSLVDRVVQNDVRWNALRYWARYLGFAGSYGGFFPDPTSAVRDEVRRMLKVDEEVPADIFINQLSSHLPILDGGTARVMVEDRMASQKWMKPQATDLSLSLSFALRRLTLEKTISLETRSDAGQGFSIVRKGYGQKQPFTHIRRMAGLT